MVWCKISSSLFSFFVVSFLVISGVAFAHNYVNNQPNPQVNSDNSLVNSQFLQSPFSLFHEIAYSDTSDTSSDTSSHVDNQSLGLKSLYLGINLQQEVVYSDTSDTSSDTSSQDNSLSISQFLQSSMNLAYEVSYSDTSDTSSDTSSYDNSLSAAARFLKSAINLAHAVAYADTSDTSSDTTSHEGSSSLLRSLQYVLNPGSQEIYFIQVSITQPAWLTPECTRWRETGSLLLRS